MIVIYTQHAAASIPSKHSVSVSIVRSFQIPAHISSITHIFGVVFYILIA